MIATSASGEVSDLFEQAKRQYDAAVTDAMRSAHPTLDMQRRLTETLARLNAAQDAMRRARRAQ